MEYDFFMVGTKEQLEAYYPGIRTLVEKYINEAKTAQGEMSADDIINAVLTGRAQAFIYATRGPELDVKLVLITEVVQYPKLNGLNILVLSGTGLEELADRHWSKLKGWAYMVGVRTIEGVVDDAVARFIKPLGFEKQAVFVRAML